MDKTTAIIRTAREVRDAINSLNDAVRSIRGHGVDELRTKLLWSISALDDVTRRLDQAYGSAQ